MDNFIINYSTLYTQQISLIVCDISCRTRNGVVPPLANRAALAAWPPNGVHVAGQVNSSTQDAPNPLQASNQGI